MFGGVLLERHYFKQVDSASTALYEDRLMPATFVYQLSDYIHQRHRTAEKIHLIQRAAPTGRQAAALAKYRRQMDSIVLAFEKTYLVQDESASLARLNRGLTAYDATERRLLAAPASAEYFNRLEGHLDAIRSELLQLSSIQTSVGRDLLTDSERAVASANAIGKFEIGILIACCLVVQILVLSTKVVRSPIVQQNPNLN
jgi:hypothetical protein